MKRHVRVSRDSWIDELERDLGQSAVIRLLANAGGQRRNIPELAEGSRLAAEVGEDIVRWLSRRFAKTTLDIPSPRGREQQDRANRLRAAILDAGLTDPRRSANVIAAEFGVSAKYVHNLRSKMRKEYGLEPYFPLFDEPG